MERFERLTAVAAPLVLDNLDTDQIFPARFSSKDRNDGRFGSYLLHDHRFDESGCERAGFILNDQRLAGSRIFVAAENYACGSGRAGAIFAHVDFGIRAILAESFAEIFFGNATTLGLPCVTAARTDLNIIRERVSAHPKQEMRIDLVLQTATFGDEVFPVSLRASARDALINGRWDAIGELLEAGDLVARKASTLPYFQAQSVVV